MSDINKTYVFDSEIIFTGGTSGGTNTDDYTITAVLNGTDLEFTRISGGTYSVDLSTVTITATTENTDDFTTGATLSGGILEFTRISGATYSVDLSALSVTGSTNDDYTTGATLSGNTLVFTRLSGGTYDVDLSSITTTGSTGPIIFSCETSGNTSYVGYGELNACKIRKIDTVSGATYTAYWSNGEELLDKLWANRYTYPYF